MPLLAQFFQTELLEKKNLPSLEELMFLKRQKEDTFFVFAATFLSKSATGNLKPRSSCESASRE